MSKKNQNSTLLFWLKFIISLFIVAIFFYFILIHKFTEIDIQPLKWQTFFPKNQSYITYVLTAKNLIQQKPEIVSIQIQPNLYWKKLKINIREAKPIAIICYSEKCYLLDSYARILNNNQKNELFLIESKQKIVTGILNPKLTEMFYAIFSYSKWKPYPIKKAIIHKNLDISIYDLNDKEFLFDPNQSIVEQIKKWHLILNDQRIQEAKRIDLRIPKKIFILPKNINFPDYEQEDNRNDIQV